MRWYGTNPQQPEIPHHLTLVILNLVSIGYWPLYSIPIGYIISLKFASNSVLSEIMKHSMTISWLLWQWRCYFSEGKATGWCQNLGGERQHILCKNNWKIFVCFLCILYLLTKALNKHSWSYKRCKRSYAWLQCHDHY